MRDAPFCRCPSLETVPACSVLHETCPLCGRHYSLQAWRQARRKADKVPGLRFDPKEPPKPAVAAPRPPVAHSDADPGERAEVWRPVAGTQGYYEVSNLGQVRRAKAGRGSRVGHILLPIATRRKKTVTLLINKQKRTVLIEELIKAAFPNQEEE